VVDTEVMSDEILEALLDREICNKPVFPSGEDRDIPSQNDETNKTFFKVLEETDSTGRDLQGINAENSKSSTSESIANDTSSS